MRSGNKDLYGYLKGQGDYFNTQNLLLNGNFEYWYAGTTSSPDGWATFGAGVTKERESTEVKVGTYSAKLTRNGANCYFYQYAHLEKGIYYWQGKNVTLSCWVKCDTSDVAIISITDGVETTFSSYHTGSGNWELLTLTRTIDNSATKIQCNLYIITNDATAYFDGAMLVEGSVPFAFTPHPEDHLYEQNIFGVSYMSAISNADDDNHITLTTYPNKYAYPKNANKGIHLLINLHADSRGKSIILDEARVYYYTDGGTGDVDFFNMIYFFQDNGDGTQTSLITHGNLGNGTSGNENHNLVDSPTEMEDKPIFIRMVTEGMDLNTDVRVYSIIIKYHVKVHG